MEMRVRSRKGLILILLALLFMMNGCGLSQYSRDVLLDTGTDVLEKTLDTLGISVSDEDNPLRGLETDERVIMCLKINYPDHEFSVVEPYDSYTDSGIYQDENGIQFSVHNFVRDSSTNFAATDEYFSTLLKRQGFPEKAKEICEQNGVNLEIDDTIIMVKIIVEENTLTVPELSKIIEQLTQLVDMPRPTVTEMDTFSTGKITYYTYPNWGHIRISFQNEDYDMDIQGKIYFDDSMEMIQSFIYSKIQYALVDRRQWCYDHPDSEYTPQIRSDETVWKKSFATYGIDNKWEEMNPLDETKLIEYNNVENAFSVECVPCEYKEEQYNELRAALRDELIEEFDITEDSNLTCETSLPGLGYILLTFHITKDDGEELTNYYIVGNEQYCLIQAIGAENAEKCKPAIEDLIDCFQWN